MKIVRNNIFEKFEEDSDPIYDMGMGLAKIVDKLLLDMNDLDKDSYDFKILSGNNIEVTQYLFGSRKEYFTKTLLKYEETDPFVVKNNQTTYQVGWLSPVTENWWNMMKIHWGKNRYDKETYLKFYEDHFFQLKKTTENKEYLDCMCEALNKKYPKVQGLIFVKKIMDNYPNER